MPLCCLHEGASVSRQQCLDAELPRLSDLIASVSQQPDSVTLQVMRVVGYLRVSSATQIDAWGLDRQESAIRAYARTHDHRIVAWERDEGVSGTIEGVDRPGLSAAIKRIGHGVEAILIADLDRFARKLTVQEAALAVVWKAGGRVLTATSGEVREDDPDDPSRTLIRQVMGAVIEFEKRQSVKRMRDGMIEKAKAGKKATGSYSYGWTGTGKGRERDAGPLPAEQQAVDRILALRAAGTSYRAICGVLDDEGFRPRRAERWLPMTVRRIAEREAVRAVS